MLKPPALTFKPFAAEKSLVLFYLRHFKMAKKEGRILAKTPQTKAGVIAWLEETGRSSAICYWLIYDQKKLVGHCGLRDINQRLKITKTASFFTKTYASTDNYYQAFQFCLKQADQKKLTTIVAEVFANESGYEEALFRLGFSLDVSGTGWIKTLPA